MNQYKPELGRFYGDSNPEVWVFQAERYFNFYGFSKDSWLSMPYVYFKGEARAWFDWLYRNNQFYDWNHFKKKLAMHYSNHTFTDRMRHMGGSSDSQSVYTRPAHSSSSTALLSAFEPHMAVENTMKNHSMKTEAQVFDKKSDTLSADKRDLDKANNGAKVETPHSCCSKVFDSKKSDTKILSFDMKSDLKDGTLQYVIDDTRETMVVAAPQSTIVGISQASHDHQDSETDESLQEVPCLVPQLMPESLMDPPLGDDLEVPSSVVINVQHHPSMSISPTLGVFPNLVFPREVLTFATLNHNITATYNKNIRSVNFDLEVITDEFNGNGVGKEIDLCVHPTVHAVYSKMALPKHVRQGEFTVPNQNIGWIDTGQKEIEHLPCDFGGDINTPWGGMTPTISVFAQFGIAKLLGLDPIYETVMPLYVTNFGFSKPSLFTKDLLHEVLTTAEAIKKAAHERELLLTYYEVQLIHPLHTIVPFDSSKAASDTNACGAIISIRPAAFSTVIIGCIVCPATILADSNADCHFGSTFAQHFYVQFSFDPGINLFLVNSCGPQLVTGVGNLKVNFQILTLKSHTKYTSSNSMTMTKVWDPRWRWLVRGAYILDGLLLLDELIHCLLSPGGLRWSIRTLALVAQLLLQREASQNARILETYLLHTVLLMFSGLENVNQIAHLTPEAIIFCQSWNYVISASSLGQVYSNYLVSVGTYLKYYSSDRSLFALLSFAISQVDYILRCILITTSYMEPWSLNVIESAFSLKDLVGIKSKLISAKTNCEEKNIADLITIVIRYLIRFPCINELYIRAGLVRSMAALVHKFFFYLKCGDYSCILDLHLVVDLHHIKYLHLFSPVVVRIVLTSCSSICSGKLEGSLVVPSNVKFSRIRLACLCTEKVILVVIVGWHDDEQLIKDFSANKWSSSISLPNLFYHLFTGNTYLWDYSVSSRALGVALGFIPQDYLLPKDVSFFITHAGIFLWIGWSADSTFTALLLMLLCLNLEDKVLIEGGSIVMNELDGPEQIEVFERENDLYLGRWSKQPNRRVDLVWDPG